MFMGIQNKLIGAVWFDLLGLELLLYLKISKITSSFTEFEDLQNLLFHRVRGSLKPPLLLSLKISKILFLH